ncbi:transcription factor HES-7.1-like [Menidia menidia]
MKLLQEPEDATSNRKLIKSQVEKRRRERMNHSLERLRTMLLQQPRQGGTRHRLEKAEILEHTVLFLQKAAGAPPPPGAGGPGAALPGRVLLLPAEGLPIPGAEVQERDPHGGHRGHRGPQGTPTTGPGEDQDGDQDGDKDGNQA